VDGDCRVSIVRAMLYLWWRVSDGVRLVELGVNLCYCDGMYGVGCSMHWQRMCGDGCLGGWGLGSCWWSVGGVLLGGGGAVGAVDERVARSVGG